MIKILQPHAELKKFAELRDVKLDDMVLIHENDIHYNLIVSKNSDLADLGSLSVREDILENDVQTNIKELNDEEPCETEVIKQLKKIKESKKNIENEY